MNPRPDLAELHALVRKWRDRARNVGMCRDERLCGQADGNRECADDLAAALRKIEQDSAATGAQGEAVVLRGADEFARGDYVRHKKTGGVYLIETRAFIEKTMIPAYVYRAEDGQCFVRPDSEMLDGRFERIKGPHQRRGA